jgi:hypothetical protein
MSNDRDYARALEQGRYFAMGKTAGLGTDGSWRPYIHQPGVNHRHAFRASARDNARRGLSDCRHARCRRGFGIVGDGLAVGLVPHSTDISSHRASKPDDGDHGKLQRSAYPASYIDEAGMEFLPLFRRQKRYQAVN